MAHWDAWDTRPRSRPEGVADSWQLGRRGGGGAGGGEMAEELGGEFMSMAAHLCVTGGSWRRGAGT